MTQQYSGTSDVIQHIRKKCKIEHVSPKSPLGFFHQNSNCYLMNEMTKRIDMLHDAL